MSAKRTPTSEFTVPGQACGSAVESGLQKSSSWASHRWTNGGSNSGAATHRGSPDPWSGCWIQALLPMPYGIGFPEEQSSPDPPGKFAVMLYSTSCGDGEEDE